MRTFVISLLFLSIVVAAPFSASAATNPGVKPGSFFYFFDTAFEKVNLFFTFSPEKKARKALEYADERLAEAETLTESKDSNMVQAVMENYTANIALAVEKSKEVKDQQASENLLSTIADNTSKNQEVLSSVLAKVPEEAKDAIAKAIEVSKKEQEEAIKQIAQLKGEVEQLKKEVAELKKESNDPRADEVEKLKKEVEEPKKKQGTAQSAPKQPTPTTQNSQEQKKLETTTTDNALEIQRIAEEQKRQEEIRRDAEEAKIKAEQERLRDAQRLADQRVVEERQKELERQQQLENQRLAEEKQETEEVGTEVQGVISQNTVWTTQNNPYIVTDDIVIEKNITLTINPGVIIKFKKGKGKSNFSGFEILNRGNILAKGNENNKIIFTSYESNPQIGSWGTIEVVSGGSIHLDYVNIEFASYGLVAVNASSAIVTRSSFKNSGVGIFTSSAATISDNIIENNRSGITYGGLAYSFRDDGSFSYPGVKRIEITHNTIRNNIGQGLANSYHAGIVIQDSNNSDIVIISYNDIYNNGSGVKFTNSRGSKLVSIENNNIYNHSDYNIWFQDQGPEIVMPNNWWGTTDIAAIDSKMYDYKSNPVTPLPKIDYQPFATSEITDAGIE